MHCLFGLYGNLVLHFTVVLIFRQELYLFVAIVPNSRSLVFVEMSLFTRTVVQAP